MENQIATRPTYGVKDLTEMAGALGKGGLFGKTPEQLLPLMLLAQAEGRNPVLVATEYDVIQGRPAITSRAALAHFQAAGGRIEWLERSDTRACAKFIHPQGGELEVSWTMAQATQAGLTKKGGSWSSYPRQMLSARVVAEGVRAILPGCLGGMYLSEEVADMGPMRQAPDPVTSPAEPRNSATISAPVPAAVPAEDSPWVEDSAPVVIGNPEPLPLEDPAPDLKSEAARLADLLGLDVKARTNLFKFCGNDMGKTVLELQAMLTRKVQNDPMGF